ncbi:MAG: hypothetical protein H6834_05205 [Planctomycetes bacterium]|nr:hypothetical protein [Planctomycetota bacterium]
MRAFVLPWSGAFTALRRVSVPLFVFAVMLLVGLTPVLVHAVTLEEALDGYAGRAELASGYTAEFDGELRRTFAQSFETLDWSLSAAMFGTLFLAVFFSAGWAVLFGEEKTTTWLHSFVGGGARFFLRSLRITLIFLILVVATNRLLFGADTFPWVLEKLYGVRTLAELPTDRLAFQVDMVRGLSFLLLYGAFLYLTRLAKVIIVVDTREDTVDGDVRERQSALLAYVSALWFSLRHPVRSVLFGLSYLTLCGLVLGAALFAMPRLHDWASSGTGWAIGTYAGMALVFVFVMHGVVRAACFAGLTELYFETLEDEANDA